MRGVQAAVAAVVLVGSIVAGVSSASAQFRIANDRGGQIGAYLQQFAMIRDSGSQVVIDGTCLSACTLVLGTVPRDRICVTSRANLGFHAAWNPAPGGRTVYSSEGTRLLWEIYPSNIRSWIRRKGGLTAKMIYLKGKELSAMYASCPQDAGTQVARSTRATSRTAARAAGGRALFAATRGAM
jgi:hypothetical protein